MDINNFNAAQVSGGVMSLGATTAGLVNLSGHYTANPQALDACPTKKSDSFLTSSFEPRHYRHSSSRDLHPPDSA